MAKFEIEWSEEIWKRIVLEAEDIEHAKDLFYNGKYGEAEEEITGGEMLDSVDIGELEEN